MCKIDNLVITEYHPMLDTTQMKPFWEFPINLIKSTQMDLEWMYNIVLDSQSAYWVEIEGFKCVSLGHNITQNQATEETKNLVHDYFGSSKVIKDLEQFQWDLST
jgi:hypothetical protein